MINLYCWDSQRIYSHTVEVDVTGAIPPQSTSTPVPELVGNQVARWVGGSWQILDQRPEPDPEPALPRKITTLAFLSRFSDEEAVAIDLASIGATIGAAMIRRYLAKVNAADHIDLTRQDLIAGLDAIEVGGLIGAGRAAEIIESPVQPHEVPQA